MQNKFTLQISFAFAFYESYVELTLAISKLFIIELSDKITNVLHNLLIDYPDYNSALPVQSQAGITNVK